MDRVVYTIVLLTMTGGGDGDGDGDAHEVCSSDEERTMYPMMTIKNFVI